MKERKPQGPDVNFYLLLLSRRILIAVLNSLKLPRAVLQMLNYIIYRSEEQKKRDKISSCRTVLGSCCADDQWQV